LPQLHTHLLNFIFKSFYRIKWKMTKDFFHIYSTSFQVHFAKLQSPHCYFSICQIDFTSLPNPLCQMTKAPQCQVQVAKSTLPNDRIPHCQVQVAKSPFPRLQLHIKKSVFLFFILIIYIYIYIYIYNLWIITLWCSWSCIHP
jgi:hypothetical protein